MKNKKIAIAVLAVVLVAALMAGLWWFTRPETQEGSKSITVTVVHKDGSEKVFTYKTNEEYLGPVLTAEGLIQGDDSEYGMMIHTVDGEKADYTVDQGWWQILIGDEASTVGIDSIPVTDGGEYQLVYTVG